MKSLKPFLIAGLMVILPVTAPITATAKDKKLAGPEVVQIADISVERSSL